MKRNPRGKLWIGTSGWSYPDWRGIVYPRRTSRAFKPLSFLSRFVNAVEVNTSFYRLPTARMTAKWPQQTPPGFRFAFKLTKSLTHQRAAVPDPAEARKFIAALEPVRDAGKLGPVLLQFPWSFRYSGENAEYLLRLSESVNDVERAIEVRHASWEAGAAQQLLASCGAACSIDQPPLPGNLGPAPCVAQSTGYVRLHGRNSAAWFAEDVPAYERYNYLYDERELREWVTRIEAMQEQSRSVYVFTNNHYRGQALANALELRAMLAGERVAVPQDLARTHPQLAQVARPAAEPTLFD